MIKYVELHCHSSYSPSNGASMPLELLEQAASLGMEALALTDDNNVYGVPSFIQAAKDLHIHPIVGTAINLEHNHDLTLLVERKAGWSNQSILITAARMNAPKGQASLPIHLLQHHTDGLIALSGGRKGEIASAILRKDYVQAEAHAKKYIDWFGRNNFYIELQHHLLPEDDALVADLVALANHLKVPYVATNEVHYARHEGQALDDVLVSIGHNKPLEETKQFHRPNGEYYLKTGLELSPLFARFPFALKNSLQISERCVYTPKFGMQDLPVFPTPNGQAADDYLRQLCLEALPKKYRENQSRAREQLERELRVIADKGFSNYFLIVWDIVQWARKHGIRCQGRGSAANSLVAYLLDISPVDPLAHDLVFERFMSDISEILADIDIDFDAKQRDEVMQYIYETYGEHAAMVCNFVTRRFKSSVRDVGKVLGISKDALDYIVATGDVLGKQSERVKWIAPKTLHQLDEYSQAAQRHLDYLSIHVGGFILTRDSLASNVPVEPARKKGQKVIQWDTKSAEYMGMVKFDILGLKTLTAISECLKLIEQHMSFTLDLDAIPLDDRSVYDMICYADTVGIFQVESRAQAQMLPRMRPRTFLDLIIAISLIRPGPILGDMVHPYLRRRSGQEPVDYDHPLLVPATKETLGVILFQEQVVKIARDFAGFSAGQGELLRRALSHKDAEEEIEKFHKAFVEGAIAKGVSREIAERVFNKLLAFGGYSFPKSHAASFAILVYQAAYLKRYYPAAFLAAILNNQPMGFWSPAIIVNDAKRHGIPLYSIDANISSDTCTLEGTGIRMGLKYVKGFGEVNAKKFVEKRKDTPFKNLTDCCRRTQLPKRLIKNLIYAGGFDWIGKARRDLDWELDGISTNPNELPLDIPEEPVQFPPMSRSQTLEMEFRLTGVSLHEHPMELYRKALKKRGVLDSRGVQKAAQGTVVVVAGLNVVHQAPPTAKGFHFITLETEDGFINIIVNPRMYARYRTIIRHSPILVVRGIVERDGAVTNIKALHVEA